MIRSLRDGNDGA